MWTGSNLNVHQQMNKDVVYIHKGLLLSHKNNEIMPLVATQMDLEFIIISEVSQTEKDKHHMIWLICGI